MEDLEGRESANGPQDGRGNSRAVKPYTFKMPISKDVLEPIALHLVKSPLWWEGCEPSTEDNAGDEHETKSFAKFSPHSEKNKFAMRQSAISLRYSNSQGILDCIALPNVAKRDIRVEVHEEQISLIALAQDEPQYYTLDVGVDDHEYDLMLEPSRIYTFNTKAINTYAILAGYRKGQFQLYRGLVEAITIQPNLNNTAIRNQILVGNDTTLHKDS